MSGGISNAVLNAMDIGANSFALFLKSPRKWVSPDIKEEEIKKFHELCENMVIIREQTFCHMALTLLI